MTRDCACCGKPFTFYSIREQSAKWCSYTCAGLGARRRVEWQCSTCGKMAIRTLSAAAKSRNCNKCGPRIRDYSKDKPRSYDKIRQIVKSPEYREKLRKVMTGLPKLGPKGRKGSRLHPMARHFFARSPVNVVYWVSNISEFVRRNTFLFQSEDVQWNARNRRCNATGGLSSIVRPTDPRRSWKGWELVSKQETPLPCDILNRKTLFP